MRDAESEGRWESNEEMMPRICVVSSDAGKAVIDFFFCDYTIERVFVQGVNLAATFPINEENNVLRPRASTKPSHTAAPPNPDIA